MRAQWSTVAVFGRSGEGTSVAQDYRTTGLQAVPLQKMRRNNVQRCSPFTR